MATPIKGQRPRIGVDLHVLEGIRQGSQTFCLEIFSRVAAKLPEADFVFFVDMERWHRSQAERFGGDNVVVAHMPHASAAKRLLVSLPQLTKKYGVDLLHTQYISPPFLSAHRALTIHDILFEEFPQYFDWKMRWRSKLLFRMSAKSADLIFTASEYSKQQLVTRYGIADAAVTMIYHAANRTTFCSGAAGVAQVEALGLKAGEYILTVGRLEPRKNHAGLLRAYAGLPAPRPRLVIAGQQDFGYQEVFELYRSLQLQDDVLFCDFADDALLGALYRSAKLFVYPSFAEGFGLPVVEAMASGTPVITGNRTSLPEIAGDACLQIDPNSVEQIRAAMQSVLGDAELAAMMTRDGLRQSDRFSWDYAADALVQKYRVFFSL